MALRTRQELRPKFANLKRPPQEDFWDWQDSYWHKLDEIDATKVVLTEDGGRKTDIVTLINNNEFTIGLRQLQNLLNLGYIDGRNDLRRIVNIETNLEWAEL